MKQRIFKDTLGGQTYHYAPSERPCSLCTESPYQIQAPKPPMRVSLGSVKAAPDVKRRRVLLTLLFLAAVLLVLLSGCSTPQRSYFERVKGSKVRGQCLPYAQRVLRDFQAIGVPAREVGFEWIRMDEHGTHAVVLYRIGDKLFFVDNEHPEPRQVVPGDVLWMVQQLWPEAIALYKGQLP